MLIVNHINATLYDDVNHLEIMFRENQNEISVLYEDVTTLKDNWNNVEPNLCLMFNHKDLSLITDSLTLIQSYVELNDYEDAYAQLILLKEYAEKSDHVMGFNFQNLL